jgi:delta-aminolevulinic acid dehydratase/porphobilinogen synthase
MIDGSIKEIREILEKDPFVVGDTRSYSGIALGTI